MMKLEKVEGILLDVDYVTANNESVIRLFVKTKKGIEFFEDSSFKPYFFVIVDDTEKAIKDLRKIRFSEEVKVKEVSRIKKRNAENVLKLTFNSTRDLTVARTEVKDLSYVVERREFDIPFAKRYIIDKGLEPMNGISLNVCGKEVKEVKVIEKEADLKIGAFDLETLSPERFSNPKKDPIIMASFVKAREKTVLTTNKKLEKVDFVKVFSSEKEMIEKLAEKISAKNLDVVVTYNGDLFDFPYLKERAENLKIKLKISADGSEPKSKKKGLSTAVRLKGEQHLDVYQLVRLLTRFGVINLIKFDLESVVEALFKKKKKKIVSGEINKIWKTNKGLKELAEYNLEDSVYTLKIAEAYLPLLVEISKLVRQTMFDVNRASASMLVESLLINKCFETSNLVPNKPEESSVRQRILQTYEGGFVREPKPGLHENIAVLDFSSLHPTIMISHNISPETLNCDHKECKKNMAPTKQYFCTKKEGFLSSILKQLFEKRMKIKKELKKWKKDDKKYSLLFARQHALKIMLNSFYGYLGYARSRWYSRECARAVTAWSRSYVQEVAEKAQKEGFEVLYGDTDSCFLKIPKEKTRKDVFNFMEKINQSLPGIMHLELEGFFKRGIFVTRRAEDKAAKKRYALIDFNNNLKIVGFEYVRRDWAGIAKETQRAVIQAILEEGKPEKAIEMVKSVVKKLKEGKAKKEELTIFTQIKKSLKSYESIGPHIAAAKKAIKKGKALGIGSVIGYIVTRSGKSISDKAELEEFVAEGNYDAEYYIKNQVLPAVIKIMRELGYSEDDLIQGGKQVTLNSF